MAKKKKFKEDTLTISYESQEGLNFNVSTMMQMSTIVTVGEKKYYFFPYWIEDLKEGNLNLHHLGSLPKELIEAIKKERNEKS